MHYYDDYLSPRLKEHQFKKAKNIFGIDKLKLVGEPGGLENEDSLKFLVELYRRVLPELEDVLKNRIKDRSFIDSRTLACAEYNRDLGKKVSDPDYATILGEKDGDGQIVIGPYSNSYITAIGEQVAPIPDYLAGYHVTLFGPPDSEKMCINAMNSFHRKLKNEPEVVEELVSNISYTPKWGADSEDSKTPLHSDLKSAGVNLSKSLSHTIYFKDEKKNKEYKLKSDHLSHAIKRFPGLALPSFFLFYQNMPIPLHLYDFCLHAFENWDNPEALVFYVPKLENEFEARYIKNLMKTFENMIKEIHSEYKLGTIRLMIVLENPRAVFRVNEIMDELYPYFVGASLGWHDYLGSTARLFKNDPNYRIPVKADPDIVIKYIKASHSLLSDVVGERGGIKVGGMYGILPTSYDLDSPSLQVTLVGYIRDVVTQLKRNLTGFWVAHPDFVRLGMAIVEAFKIHKNGDSSKLDLLITSLLDQKYHKEVLGFVHGQDIKGLDRDDPLYARSLIVADVGESNIIANNDEKEIRYNVFQSLQYITDWLMGNGCVALPTNIGGEAVRIMDDLATAERSRWEVWHELHHGRFDLHEFLKISFEELQFIRKDLSNEKKIVQVKWTAENEKWYPVAFNLMIKLMTDDNPCEFATELFLPFTIDAIRESDDPWQKALELDHDKFKLKDEINRFNYYFDMCGEIEFARTLSGNLSVDMREIEEVIMNFDQKRVIAAASFHGDIGEPKKGLERKAKEEQSKVSDGAELLELGNQYKDKFGFKFLVSAKGKSGDQMKDALLSRMNRSKEEELKSAKEALFEITKKRIQSYPLNNVIGEIESLKKKFNIVDFGAAVTFDGNKVQSLGKDKIFQIASLSKTIGSAVAIDFFSKNQISLQTSVNQLLEKYQSEFRITASNDSLAGLCEKVNLEHLMGHCSLNMHYVNGIPLSESMPKIEKFLNGLSKYGYDPIELINSPGTKFSYSGAGFIVLEYLLELISGKSFSDLMSEYGLGDFLLDKGREFVAGRLDDGSELSEKMLQFPIIAAGMCSKPLQVTSFLAKLSDSFQNPAATSFVSHDTAVSMLHGRDLGSKKFMNCKMGLGIFTADAGKNRLMIHQGANDGYRALFLHCYKGPDAGKGFSLFATGELNAVMFLASVSKLLLSEMSFIGVDFSKVLDLDEFSTNGLIQEEIVNQGYKKLVFDFFVEDQAETYLRESVDPFYSKSLLVGSSIEYVSNDGFAPASNLICSYEPIFDPEFFGRQGKVMDSWESVRHNPFSRETLHLKLTRKSFANYVYLSTKYHDGNQVEFVEIEGLVEGRWVNIVEKISMDGHSFRKIKLKTKLGPISEVKAYTYPDGGFTRLAIFEDCPDEDSWSGENIRYPDDIPTSKKELFLERRYSNEDIIRNLKRSPRPNLASDALGAKISSASNEHYAPASRVISAFGAIDMFDGLESARNRDLTDFEQVKIQLARKAILSEIEFDFRYFVNNNPKEVEVTTSTGEIIVSKQPVKAFAGNIKRCSSEYHKEVSEVVLKTFPCGGMNRIRIYAKN